MKSSSYTIGLAFALALTAAGAASAQSAQRPARGAAAQSDSGFRRGPDGPGARGQRGGGEAMLLRGINLTNNQKTRLQEMRANARKDFDKQGGRARPDGAQAQGRDSVAMAARRAEMQKRREQHFASVRSILDAKQRVQFDKNVAEMKAHGPRQGRDGGQRGGGNDRD